jgi:hypothetical protein
MRQKPRLTLHPILLLFACITSHGFVLYSASTSKTGSSLSDATKTFEVMIQMPPSGSDLQANIVLEPILSTPSEIVEVRYKVPFGLNVEPKKGLAVCTKDGEGGERAGDILRYTSQWNLSLPRGSGLLTQAAAFSGGLSWQCSMFNVLKAKEWREVVEALLSNEQVSLVS